MQDPNAAQTMEIFRRWFTSAALLLLAARLKPASRHRPSHMEELASTLLNTSAQAPPPICISPSLRSLRLRNSSNLCYIHAVAMLLAYAIDACRSFGPCVVAAAVEQTVVRLSGTPLEKGSISLLALLPWRLLLQGWPAIQEQHDCAEFLRFLLSRFDMPQLCCHWQAREDDISEGVSVPPPCLQGSALIELLSMSAADSLQDCISSWSAQIPTHALVMPPRIVFLCVARCVDPERGKDDRPLPCEPQQRVLLPVFQGRTSAVSWSPYQVVGGVLHLGPTPKSGHYTEPSLHTPLVPLRSVKRCPRLRPLRGSRRGGSPTTTRLLDPAELFH